MTRYPEAPGYRNTDTSIQAAEELRPKAKICKEKVLMCLKENRSGLTSYEMSQKTGIPYHTVQPRTSELRIIRQIKDSGIRRVNPETQKNSIVWVYRSKLPANIKAGFRLYMVCMLLSLSGCGTMGTIADYQIGGYLHGKEEMPDMWSCTYKLP